MKYEDRNDFVIERVQTHSNNITDVVNQIENIVARINNRIFNLEKPLHWVSRDEQRVKIRNKNELSIYDDITFYSITQTINDLFDWGRKSSGGPSRGYFKYKHDRSMNLWFAKRNIFKKDKELAISGYVNRLSRDGKEILEFPENANEVEAVVGESFNENTDDIRITFLKYRNNLGEDGYKFVGIFNRVGWVATSFNGKIVRAERYVRISEKMSLPERDAFAEYPNVYKEF